MTIVRSNIPPLDWLKLTHPVSWSEIVGSATKRTDDELDLLLNQMSVPESIVLLEWSETQTI